jgi:tetratricopeptide (TPR) repeat protein
MRSLVRALLGPQLLALVVAAESSAPLPCAAETPRDQAAALLREGNALYDQKNYEGALVRYRLALSLYPSYKLQLNLGLHPRGPGAAHGGRGQLRALRGAGLPGR